MIFIFSRKMVKEEGIFKNALTDSTQTLTVHFIANKIFVFIESAMVKFCYNF